MFLLSRRYHKQIAPDTHPLFPIRKSTIKLSKDKCPFWRCIWLKWAESTCTTQHSQTNILMLAAGFKTLCEPEELFEMGESLWGEPGTANRCSAAGRPTFGIVCVCLGMLGKSLWPQFKADSDLFWTCLCYFVLSSYWSVVNFMLIIIIKWIMIIIIIIDIIISKTLLNLHHDTNVLP